MACPRWARIAPVFNRDCVPRGPTALALDLASGMLFSGLLSAGLFLACARGVTGASVPVRTLPCSVSGQTSNIASASSLCICSGYLLSSALSMPSGLACSLWVQRLSSQWPRGRFVATVVLFRTTWPSVHWSKERVRPPRCLSHPCMARVFQIVEHLWATGEVLPTAGSCGCSRK